MSSHSGDCEICRGTGFRIRQVDGYERAAPCACRLARQSERLLQQARIPRRYQHCDLESYDAIDDSQRRAKRLARQFTEAFPAIDSGILFTGSCGVGKTHLAVGIVRELVVTKGINACFIDFRELLRQIQETYSPVNSMSAADVLHPVLAADVLVLDDLGASKPTDWVRDTLGHIISRRYNEERVTLFTTNYSDGQGQDGQAAASETLSERIGAPLRSRLDEMCRFIDIRGQDYRRAVRQAAYRW